MADKHARNPCPNCGEPASMAADNPWRPFCGHRCKLIDLGDWLAEEHSIPDERQEPPWERGNGSGETH